MLHLRTLKTVEDEVASLNNQHHFARMRNDRRETRMLEDRLHSLRQEALKLKRYVQPSQRELDDIREAHVEHAQLEKEHTWARFHQGWPAQKDAERKLLLSQYRINELVRKARPTPAKTVLILQRKLEALRIQRRTATERDDASKLAHLAVVIEVECKRIYELLVEMQVTKTFPTNTSDIMSHSLPQLL